MKSESRLKLLARLFTALGFCVSGVGHFVITDGFRKIVPPFLPAPTELVYISGVFEVLGGIGLLIPRTRRAAGWGLAALLLAVYPANIYHAVSGVKVGGIIDQPIYHVFRIPMQFFLIWEVLWCSRALEKKAKLQD